MIILYNFIILYLNYIIIIYIYIYIIFYYIIYINYIIYYIIIILYIILYYINYKLHFIHVLRDSKWCDLKAYFISPKGFRWYIIWCCGMCLERRGTLAGPQISGHMAVQHSITITENLMDRYIEWLGSLYVTVTEIMLHTSKLLITTVPYVQ